MGCLDIVVERDDEDFVGDALVDFLDDARVVERVDDQCVDALLAQFVDDGALFVEVEPAHAAPDDLEAVGVVLVRHVVHGRQYVVKEVDALGEQQDPDGRVLLAGGEGLACRIRVIVELGGHVEHELCLLGFDLAAPVEHAVDRAARDTAEFGNLFDGYHDIDFLCYIFLTL